MDKFAYVSNPATEFAFLLGNLPNKSLTKLDIIDARSCT